MVDVGQDSRRLKLHTTVYTQCFSPCGKYLAAADNFGYIFIFNLSAALGPEATEETWSPTFSFKAAEGAIFTLVSTERLLISAGTGQIQAWIWADIINKGPKEQWSFDIPFQNGFSKPEVNALKIKEESGTTFLYGGCGDSKVHVWDISNGTHTLSLEGHDDYIHDIALRPNRNEIITASEDGTARIWDTRAGTEPMHIIEPYKNEECVRPRCGKWLGCVAVDKADDWVVCGGGPRLCLWHLRSLAATAVFDTGDTCQKFVMFNEDALISAGNAPQVNHWSVNGESRAQVPCTATSVYNVAINDNSENNKVLSVAGNCHKIDICTNIGYKAFSLTVR